MSFKKSVQSCYFEVYPLVVKCGERQTVHIRPLGAKTPFNAGEEYSVVVSGADCGEPWDFPVCSDCQYTLAVCGAKGELEIDVTCRSEQEYFIGVYKDEKMLERFSIYAVSRELCGLYPFVGDLHLHSLRSDGGEEPAVVCANYRQSGCDFVAITDHNRYYPSLEAIAAFKGVSTELEILTGEEVQLLPVGGAQCDVHIISVGARFSTNALVQDIAVEEKGTAAEYRTCCGKPEPIMTRAEYEKAITELAKTLAIPDDIDPMPYAACVFVAQSIKRGGGLSIFAHPNWRKRAAYHVPEKFSDALMENGVFDAFEVLGGERYYEQNGFQTARYYEQAAKGRVLSIVGSTDSHCSYEHSEGAHICCTLVFCAENSHESIIGGIRRGLSVAVDTLGEDFRIVGQRRLLRYACFILKHFMPLHDELCREEGRLLRAYIVGDEQERALSEAALRLFYGRVRRQREKFFAF